MIASLPHRAAATVPCSAHDPLLLLLMLKSSQDEIFREPSPNFLRNFPLDCCSKVHKSFEKEVDDCVEP